MSAPIDPLVCAHVCDGLELLVLERDGRHLVLCEACARHEAWSTTTTQPTNPPSDACEGCLDPLMGMHDADCPNANGDPRKERATAPDAPNCTDSHDRIGLSRNCTRATDLVAFVDSFQDRDGAR